MKFHYLDFDIRLHGFPRGTSQGHTAIAHMTTPGMEEPLTVMGTGATRIAAREAALEAAMTFLADRAVGQLDGAPLTGHWEHIKLAN